MFGLVLCISVYIAIFRTPGHAVTTQNGRALKASDEYPAGFLTSDQISNGGVILYLLGMVYMFVALSIVCGMCVTGRWARCGGCLDLEQAWVIMATGCTVSLAWASPAASRGRRGCG